MIYLFLFSVFLVLYGTLYPFHFTADAHPGAFLTRLMDSIHTQPGRGDILSNIVLFMPMGFFGMQALLQRWPRAVRFIIVVALGAALSLSIEYTQSYLVQRITSLYDLVLNTAGTFIGAAAGWHRWQSRIAGGMSAARPLTIFPLFLVAAWLGYRLFPYVPTIDFQHVKDALKPLLAMESVSVTDVLRHFVACLVVGRLLQAVTTQRLAAFGTAVLVLGCIAAKPFIMTKIIMPGETVGAILGVIVWFAIGGFRFRTGLTAMLLAVSIAVQGLIPFELRDQPTAFSFIPFSGFEQGSMAVNLQAFLEKVFLYGALIWLFVQAGLRMPISIGFVTILLTVIEFVQTNLAGRSAEITDPLLAVAMGFVLIALERQQHSSAPARAPA